MPMTKKDFKSNGSKESPKREPLRWKPFTLADLAKDIPVE
jgi:hypothetical protein